jgi:hypothetical protein
MSAKEKSDLPEVAEKRANKAASAAAELVERRGRAKENAELQSTVRTQSREAVSRAQARIREAVIRNKQDKLTALLHHINIDVLRASFFGLKKTAAPGVDEMTWTEYAEHLEASLVSLHARVHTGAYRALPSGNPENGDRLSPTRERSLKRALKGLVDRGDVLICGGNGGPGDSYRYTTVECFAGATGKKVKDTAHAKQIVAELQDAVMKVRATGGIDAAVARVRGAGRTA